MRVVLTDGSELSCTNFKAIESGVLLTKDKKRKKVFGFVSNDEVRYVIPDDFEIEEAPAAGDDAETADTDGQTDDHDRHVVVFDAPAEGSVDAEREPGTSSTADDEAVSRLDDSSLRRLSGLGSTYADRLRAAGYRTLSDLAEADPVVVADAASVPPGRGREWVNAAIRVRADAQGEERRGETDGDDETEDTGGGTADADADRETDVEAEEGANEADTGTEETGGADGDDEDTDADEPDDDDDDDE